MQSNPRAIRSSISNISIQLICNFVIRTKILKAALQLGYQDIQWLFFRTCVVNTRKDFKINMWCGCRMQGLRLDDDALNASSLRSISIDFPLWLYPSPAQSNSKLDSLFSFLNRINITQDQSSQLNSEIEDK